MEKKLQEPYHKDYKLFIVEDLWQAHYQISLIILSKELKKFNVNTDMMITNAKLAELNTKFSNNVLNIQKP